MQIKDLFIDDSGRVRSGWRFLIFVTAFVFAVTALQALVTLLVGRSGASSPWFFVLSSILMLVPALVTGWLCGRILENVPFRALGAWFTKGWLIHLIAGLIVGGATLALAVAIAVAFGGLSFTFSPEPSNVILSSMLSSLVVFSVGAAAEEALFRGYILQSFNRSDLAWLGIALTSLFFGAIHLGNPGPTLISTIDTMLAGVWFGIAYLKTRDLWFVWGMHLIWNWMLGSVFGIEVSGLTTLVSAPLLREIDSGPQWLTGASYGIEGGVASTIALIVSTIAIYFLPGLKPSEEMARLTSPHPTSAHGATVV